MSSLNLTLGSSAVRGYEAGLRKRLGKLRKAASITTLLVIMTTSSLLQALMPLIDGLQYGLTPEMRNLVGESRSDTKEYLKLNEAGNSYDFAVPETAGQGSGKHTGRVADAYSASFSAKAKNGVTVTDEASKISVTLIPDFFTRDAERVEGDHIVYLNGQNKLVYTLQYNGVKEDIIVPKYSRNELSFSFKMQLPIGTEARLDEVGNIGIFSSDPSLFGNISFGSDEDRERVEQARQNGDKTHLLMNIPAPIIKDASGKEHTDKARFTLGNRQSIERADNGSDQAKLPADVPRSLISVNQYALTITATQLKDLPYPLSIDPTMVVTAAGDFSGVNNEGGVEVDTTDNLIRRSSLSGGRVEAWQQSFMATSLVDAAAAAWNGYIYVAGGKVTAGGAGTSTVYRLQINASGSTTQDGTVSSLALGCSTCEMVAYNGFLYHVGGNNGQDRIQYVKINADGSLGTWQIGASPHAHGNSPAFTVYNGNLYLLGGNNGTEQSAVQYVPINADGSPGAVTATAFLPISIQDGKAVAYNGVMYFVGGYDGDGLGFLNRIYRTNINSDGTLGPGWTLDANTLINGRSAHSLYFLKGYLYVSGGDIAGFTSVSSDTEYARVNADGSVGMWRVTEAQGLVYGHASTQYNGYIYILGGCQNNDPNCLTPGAGTVFNSIRYTKPRPAGELHSFSTTNAIGTARVGHAVVAYNGYIYAIGGCLVLGGNSGSTTNCSTATASIEYGTINSSNGTITWNGTTTNMNGARWGINAVAYNGFLYIVSGCETGAFNTCVRQNNTFWAPINANGTIGAMTTDGDGFQVRSYYGLAAYNGYLYTVGGDIANGSLSNSVQKTQIQSNGSVGAWSNETALPVVTRDHQVVAHGGYLYTYINGSGLYSIAINTDGTLDVQWEEQIEGSAVAGNSMMIMDRGHLYVVHSTSARLIDYGRLTEDGGVVNATGGTSTLTAADPLADMTVAHDWSNAVTTYNGYIYAVSGCSGSTNDDCDNTTTTVEYAAINNGGNGLATHTVTMTDGTNWGSGRHGHDSVYLNGYIYISSGRTNNCSIGCTYPAVTSIRKGVVAANGTFDNWVTVADVPDGGRVNHQMVAVNGYMFIIAGGNDGLTPQNTVYRASINPSDGSLGAWDTLANFPIQVRDHTATVFGNAIVVTGGFDQANTTLDNTYYATVDSSGNLSSWTATDSLPGERRFHAAVGVGNKLYVLGGLDAPNNMIYNDVLVADVAASGALSNWRQVGSLPSGRHAHLAAAANGFLYFGQGCNGTTATAVTTCSNNAIDDLWVTSISSSGGIGSWVPAGGGLDGARIQTTAEVINGRFYTLGGCHSGCDATADVTNRGRFIGLGSIPRIGHISKYYDLNVGVRPTKLVVRGTKRSDARVDFAALNNNNAGTTWTGFSVGLDIDYGGATAQNITLGSGTTLSRYMFLAFIMDDSYSAVFPDAGNETTITDFDLYYISNPGKRLRGGRTFTNGADRGLQVQP